MNKIANALLKVAKELVGDFDKSFNMSLEELDAQASQLLMDLEANGWREKGGIGFYHHENHPLIYVDANGVQASIESNIDGVYLDLYADTYDELRKALRSSEYRLFQKNAENTIALIKSGDWKPYSGMNAYREIGTFVNNKYPGIAVEIYTPDGTLKICPIDNRGVNHSRSESLGIAKDFQEMEGILRRRI